MLPVFADKLTPFTRRIFFFTGFSSELWKQVTGKVRRIIELFNMTDV